MASGSGWHEAVHIWSAPSRPPRTPGVRWWGPWVPPSVRAACGLRHFGVCVCGGVPNRAGAGRGQEPAAQPNRAPLDTGVKELGIWVGQGGEVGEMPGSPRNPRRARQSQECRCTEQGQHRSRPASKPLPDPSDALAIKRAPTPKPGALHGGRGDCLHVTQSPGSNNLAVTHSGEKQCASANSQATRVPRGAGLSA